MEIINYPDNQEDLNHLYLRAIKMCIDDYPTREEMMGVYKFLVYLSSKNEDINN